MYFDNGAVEADRFDLDSHELLMLQFLEQSIQHAGLCPTIHAGVDSVPIAEALGQAAPFATVLRDVQYRVDHLKIGERNVAALYRQERFDPTELLRSDLHGA